MKQRTNFANWVAAKYFSQRVIAIASTLTNQDNAKRDIIDHLKHDQVFLIMDWAMKFLPTSFRETQRDWFGKKGKSWHVVVAVTKGDNDEIEVNFQLSIVLIA